MAGPLRLVLDADGETRDYVVLPESGAVIGRKSDCDVVIFDTTASRHHTRIEVVDGTWHVRDLDSSNGTRLNGQHVTLARLSDGDKLRVGKTMFSVVVEGGAKRVPGEGAAPVSEAGQDGQRRKRDGTAKASRRRSSRRKSTRKSDRKTGREAKESESDTDSRRSRRGLAPVRPFYLQTPVIIGASAVFVLLIIVVFSIGGGSKRRPPLQTQPTSGQSVPDFNAMGAQELYNEASKLMSRKQYDNALPVVQTALRKFSKLMDDPRHPKLVETRFKSLVMWEHQLLERQFARENEARRMGR